VIAATFELSEEKRRRVIPLPLGFMTLSEARKITRAYIERQARLTGIEKVTKIYGLIQLRPDRDRAGRTFKPKRKSPRGSRDNRKSRTRRR
jgi:hypothetical protein